MSINIRDNGSGKKRKKMRSSVLASLWVFCLIVAGVFYAGEAGSEEVKVDRDVTLNNTEAEYWQNGKPRHVRSWDEFGVVRGETYYRIDGSLEKVKKYDASGNLIEDVNYGNNGRLRETSDGWAAIVFRYDGGKLATESYYGSDGKLKERKTYGSGGQLLARQYVGDGKMDEAQEAEEFSPVPVYGHGQTDSYYSDLGQPQGSVSYFRE